MTAAKAQMASTLRADPKRTVGEICEVLGVSKATFYRYTGTLEGSTTSADVG